jgi:MFS family permease
MDSLTYLQLLRRNRSFRRLWIGQVISELGNWFNFIAALGVVRFVSHASTEAATILLIVRLIPFTLFAPLAGAFVDRWSRRSVMIATDLLRLVVALGFLFVRSPHDLWIAYLCTALLSLFGAFFEAAKNAAIPNITGERDLLAGNALMFSSRFLLMSIGAALGGWTAANVGYQAAFVINAISFLASAYSVWLVPEDETRQSRPQVEESGAESASLSTKRSQRRRRRAGRHRGYWTDIREGWSYIISHGPVAAILGANILWATGGGAINLIAERLGALVFAGANLSQDSAVAALYFANGVGLFLGMMIARRVGAYFEFRGTTVRFIGWSLFIQGIFFSLMGVMPVLWLAGLMLVFSRILLVPDNLRGRVSTTDRAAEMLIWSFSTAIAGWSLNVITVQMLKIISGLLSGTAGLGWLILFATKKVRLPKRFNQK